MGEILKRITPLNCIHTIKLHLADNLHALIKFLLYDLWIVTLKQAR